VKLGHISKSPSRPVEVIGFSLGECTVAAMVACDGATQFCCLVSAVPRGITPLAGDLMDLFTVTVRAQLNARVHDV
jgi:hypothetical protein